MPSTLLLQVTCESDSVSDPFGNTLQSFDKGIRLDVAMIACCAELIRSKPTTA